MVVLLLHSLDIPFDAASPCHCVCPLKLSQIKDKEYTTGLQEYEDDVGTHHAPQSFAVLNRSTSKFPPHTASVSNIAELEIVMGSQARSPVSCIACNVMPLFVVTL